MAQIGVVDRDGRLLPDAVNNLFDLLLIDFSWRYAEQLGSDCPFFFEL